MQQECTGIEILTNSKNLIPVIHFPFMVNKQ